jgi:hypothetical protein
MTPRTIFLLLVFVLFPNQARADWFHTMVRFECLRSENKIVITHLGAYNEAGEAMLKNKKSNEWDPWQLVKARDDKDGTRIIGIQKVKKTCRLSDGTYIVVIRPVPGNYNIQGSCGAHMSSGVSISRGKKKIFDSDFEGDCHDMSPITTEVTVRAGSDTADTKSVKWDDFYK